MRQLTLTSRVSMISWVRLRLAAAMAGKGARLAEEAGESVTRADALIVRGIAQAKGEIADEDAAREEFEVGHLGQPEPLLPSICLYWMGCRLMLPAREVKAP